MEYGEGPGSCGASVAGRMRGRLSHHVEFSLGVSMISEIRGAQYKFCENQYLTLRSL